MKLMSCISVVCACLSTVSGDTYIAEGLFVVDNEVLKSYVREIPGSNSYAVKTELARLDLKEDVKYMLSESSNVFPSSSMRYRRPNAINTDVALDKFDRWLEDNNMYGTYNYDFAFLWTGFDLYGERGLYSTGYAHVGTVCGSTMATGVGEFNKTYHTVLTTARVIAHILGSYFSGPASQNIMKPMITADVQFRWSFSNCSATDIDDYIRTLPHNCLLTTGAISTKPTLSYGSYSGQILNVDAICRRRLNHTASYSLRDCPSYDSSTSFEDSICTQICCRVPGTMTYVLTFPSEGIMCDVGKRCHKGRCIPDSTALLIDCVFGDQPIVGFPFSTEGSCENALYMGGTRSCYQSNVRFLCCSSCQARHTGMGWCPYGDRRLDCVGLDKDNYCPYDIGNCCAYCQNYVPTTGATISKRNEPVGQIETPSSMEVFNFTLYQFDEDDGKRIVNLE